MVKKFEGKLLPVCPPVDAPKLKVAVLFNVSVPAPGALRFNVDVARFSTALLLMVRSAEVASAVNDALEAPAITTVGELRETVPPTTTLLNAILAELMVTVWDPVPSNR